MVSVTEPNEGLSQRSANFQRIGRSCDYGVYRLIINRCITNYKNHHNIQIHCIYCNNN